MSLSLVAGSVIGVIMGFAYFLYNLEASDMGNVIFRTNEHGKKEFTIEGIKLYLVTPFTSTVLWNESLLPVNWVVMVAVGSSIGALSSFIF